MLLALLGVAACAPERVAAQRTERFAMSAHAALGLGGKLSHCRDPNAGGFEDFRCQSLYGHLTSGRLRPSPGLGLRLSYLGWRYLSLGLSASLRSLATETTNATRFTDIGLSVGGRYPLEVGGDARLVTPYVMVSMGLTTLHNEALTRSRLQDPGYHISSVVGVEVELLPGFGFYVESGVTHFRIRRDRSGSPGMLATGFELTATHAVLNLGLRVAR